MPTLREELTAVREIMKRPLIARWAHNLLMQNGRLPSVYSICELTRLFVFSPRCAEGARDSLLLAAPDRLSLTFCPG